MQKKVAHDFQYDPHTSSSATLIKGVGFHQRPVTGPPHQLQQHSVACPHTLHAIPRHSHVADFSRVGLLPAITETTSRLEKVAH